MGDDTSAMGWIRRSNLYWKIRMKDTGDLNKDLVLKNKSMIYTQWF